MLRCVVFLVFAFLSLDETDNLVLQKEELVQQKQHDESSNIETPTEYQFVKHFIKEQFHNFHLM